MFLLFSSKIQCIQKLTSNQDINKLKKILGIQVQDDEMVDYWINNL
jgi:folliculin